MLSITFDTQDKHMRNRLIQIIPDKNSQTSLSQLAPSVDPQTLLISHQNYQRQLSELWSSLNKHSV